MNTFELLCASLPLLLFVQFNTIFPSWGSRKILHMGTGTLLMMCDVNDPSFQWATYCVTAIAVVVVWNTKLHIADVRDVGIINYLVFCSLSVFLRIQLVYMAPLFYADPFGAIVGRLTDSPKLVGSKSVNGTLAVFMVATLSFVETSFLTRLVSGGIVAIIELVSGKLDNVLIGMWLLFHHFVLR